MEAILMETYPSGVSSGEMIIIMMILVALMAAMLFSPRKDDTQ